MALLEIERLNVFHGAAHALKDVSLKVEEGELVSLLGANGAGKTSLLSTISRLVEPKSGAIRYAGADVLGMKPAELVRRGVSHCPEGRGIFPDMTVEENLLLGAYARRDSKANAAILEKALALFPVLKERFRQRGGTLSGGEQQMLALARSLMSSPKLLLLDEPSLGLAPKLIRQIFQIISDLNKGGVSILLVEQNANEALLHSSRAYVLETGRITMEGPAGELHKNPKVVEAYLG